ncbi:MAG: YciI family protein [Devosia sp.]|nr:YciI family protein [Devosia sp.]
MKYLLMLYADEKVGAQIPPEQMVKAMETMYAYRDALTKAGAFVATAALARTWDAKTLRMEGGEIKVHDGPYADTREQFGGYYIIEAPDMDAALKWAARCPAAQWGPIEVRPYMDGY